MSDTQMPCKVWSADRKVRKSVVASTLSDLKTKGKVKLGYADENVRVYLEDDGTLVDNDEYFQTLDYDTVFLLLRADESYLQQWQTVSRDEPDSSAVKGPPTAMDKITGMLRHSVADIVTLKDEELQMIVDAGMDELMSGLQRNAEETERIQDTCQRVLDEKRNMAEALELANFFKNTLKRDREEDSSEVGGNKVEIKVEKSSEHEQMATDKDEKDAQSHTERVSDSEEESSEVGDNNMESKAEKSSEDEQMATDKDVTDAKSSTGPISKFGIYQPDKKFDELKMKWIMHEESEGQPSKEGPQFLLPVPENSNFEYKAVYYLQQAVSCICTSSDPKLRVEHEALSDNLDGALDYRVHGNMPDIYLDHHPDDFTACSTILMIALCHYSPGRKQLEKLHIILKRSGLYPSRSGYISSSEISGKTKTYPRKRNTVLESSFNPEEISPVPSRSGEINPSLMSGETETFHEYSALSSAVALQYSFIPEQYSPVPSGSSEIIPSESPYPPGAINIINAHLRFIYQVLKEVQAEWKGRKELWEVARKIIVMHALKTCFAEMTDLKNHPGLRDLSERTTLPNQSEDQTKAKLKHKRRSINMTDVAACSVKILKST